MWATVVQCSTVFMLLTYRTVSVQVWKLRRESNHWSLRKGLISDEFHAPQFSFRYTYECIFYGTYRLSSHIVPCSCSGNPLGILAILHTICYLYIFQGFFGQTLELLCYTVACHFPCMQWHEGLWTAMSNSRSSSTQYATWPYQGRVGHALICMELAKESLLIPVWECGSWDEVDLS